MLEYHYSGHFCGTEPVGTHSHSGIELVLVTRGECFSGYDRGQYRGGPGTLFVIAPETAHTQSNQGEVETYYTVFSADASEFDGETRVIDTAADPFVTAWMRDLYQLQERMANEECRYLLLTLLVRLRHLETHAEKCNDWPPVLFPAIRFIENKFGMPINQELIARSAGIGVGRLKELFHTHVGLPPMTYVNRLRMTYARQILPDRYLTIGEVAGRCGFEDRNYFSRAFRKYFGMTPSEFRRSGFAVDTGKRVGS